MVAERRLVEIVSIVRPPGRIERVVAQELHQRAAKLIGPGLGDHVDHSPAGHAEFRRERIGLHPELLHRVDARCDRVLVALGQRRRAAVEQHRVGAALTAVDADTRQIEVAGVEEGRGQQRHTGREARELERIAPVQR